MGWNISQVSVGIVSTQIVAANPRRKALVIVNDSGNPIYISRGVQAVMNQGERLNASGGTFENDPFRDGLPMDAMYGINGVGASNVTVQEKIE